jgi:hypothetical protein
MDKATLGHCKMILEDEGGVRIAINKAGCEPSTPTRILDSTLIYVIIKLPKNTIFLEMLSAS